MKSTRIKNIMYAAVLLIAFGTWISVPARAGFSQGNAVTLGGEPIFRIASSYDGFSPEHRAWVAQDNLDNAMAASQDVSPEAVRVENRNGAPVVTLDGHLIVTADGASARAEKMTAESLAESWANDIRAFLQDRNRAVAYLDTLKDEHQLKGEVAMVERKLYAPAGTTLPVVLSETISSTTAMPGDSVTGTTMRDVAVGNYVIQQGSTLKGEIVETRGGNMIVAFDTLEAPDGTEIPISACVSKSAGGDDSTAPHLVCSLGIPAAAGSNCREPASVGIGATGGGNGSGSGSALVLQRTTTTTIAAGKPVGVVFENPAPVAMIIRGNAM